MKGGKGVLGTREPVESNGRHTPTKKKHRE